MPVQDWKKAIAKKKKEAGEHKHKEEELKREKDQKREQRIQENLQALEQFIASGEMEVAKELLRVTERSIQIGYYNSSSTAVLYGKGFYPEDLSLRGCVQIWIINNSPLRNKTIVDHIRQELDNIASS